MLRAQCWGPYSFPIRNCAAAFAFGGQYPIASRTHHSQIARSAEGPTETAGLWELVPDWELGLMTKDPLGHRTGGRR